MSCFGLSANLCLFVVVFVGGGLHFLLNVMLFFMFTSDVSNSVVCTAFPFLSIKFMWVFFLSAQPY